MLQSVEPEQPFAEPWHAQLFAVTPALAATGAFTWREWTEQFSAALEKANTNGAPRDGSNYYEIWLSAFETFLVAHGLADQQSLASLRSAWARAYLTTPHGSPVSLSKP